VSDHMKSTNRLWRVSGSSTTLMRIAATLEHGTPEQVSAYVPVAASLGTARHVTEEEALRAIHDNPPLLCNHLRAEFLPNMVHRIVRTCYLPQRSTNRAVDPIGHVLNKAWPMRCSVRNFSDIVSGYILKDTKVYEFVCLVLHASMLGVYSSADVKAGVPLQLLLYQHYVTSRIGKAHMAQWVQQDNYGLVFIAIKEYISFAVSMVPGLHAVLQDQYNWSGFVQSVKQQANAMRQALNANTQDPANMFACALRAIFHVRCFKCPAPVVDRCAIAESIAHHVRAVCVPDANMYTMPVRMALFSRIQSLVLANVSIAEVARAVGLSDEVACLLMSVYVPRAPAAACRKLKQLGTITNTACLLLHEFLSAWIMCFRIRTYPLPVHIQEEQRACVSERSTCVYGCSCCKQLRAFVVDESYSAGNAWACGHQKVIYDDESGVLYCGKRVEKASAQSRRMRHVADTGRSYWKAQQSMMCGYCPLLELDLLGQLLVFYGKMYMLCPRCMCVMHLTTAGYHGGSMRCVNCSYGTDTAASHQCFHCCTRNKELTDVALGQQVVKVCNECHKRWMKDEVIMSQLTEEVAHRAINERWGTNRVSVHCASI
jgi:hypothetical protein